MQKTDGEIGGISDVLVCEEVDETVVFEADPMEKVGQSLMLLFLIRVV